MIFITFRKTLINKQTSKKRPRTFTHTYFEISFSPSFSLLCVCKCFLKCDKNGKLTKWIYLLTPTWTACANSYANITMKSLKDFIVKFYCAWVHPSCLQLSLLGRPCEVKYPLHSKMNDFRGLGTIPSY